MKGIGQTRANDWLRGAAMGATDGSIQAMAHLFATFYLGLLAEDVPTAQAVLMTQAYIQAMVMGTMARPAAPKSDEQDG